MLALHRRHLAPAALVSRWGGGSFDGNLAGGNVGDTSETVSRVLTGLMFADVGVTLGTNSLGTFQLVAGTWTYTLDQAAAQNVDAGDVVNDSITFTAVDSSTQAISVSITGADDASIISGTVTGAAVKGNVPVTATGPMKLRSHQQDAWFRTVLNLAHVRCLVGSSTWTRPTNIRVAARNN